MSAHKTISDPELEKYKKYIPIAIKLATAKLEAKQNLNKKINSLKSAREYVNLSESAKLFIERFSNDIQGKKELFFSFLADEHDNESETSLTTSLTNKEQRLIDALLSNTQYDELKNLFLKRIRQLEEDRKTAARINRWAVTPLLTAASVCTSISKNAFSPIIEISQGLYILFQSLGRGIFMGLAHGYDPDLKGPQSIKFAGSGLAFLGTGLLALGLGVPLIVGLVVAPFVGLAVAALAAKFIALPLLAMSSISICLSNLVTFTAAVKDLKSTFSDRNKEDPSGSYRFRILHQLTKVVNPLMSSVFYACASVLAVAGAVALFANPVGLASLALAMGTIAIATGAVAVFSWIAGELAQRKVDALKIKFESENNNSPAPSPSIAKKIAPEETNRELPTPERVRRLSLEATAVSRTSEDLDDARHAPHHEQLFLFQKVDKVPRGIVPPIKPVESQTDKPDLAFKTTDTDPSSYTPKKK